MHVLAQDTAGWQAGYTIGVIVVIAIVALVVPILLLAHLIGKQAKDIDDSLSESVAQHRRARGAAGDDGVGPRPSPPGLRRAGASSWGADQAMLFALSSTRPRNWWWGRCAAGAVVLLAVVALLTILVVLVDPIDKRGDADPRHVQASRRQHGRHGADR